MPHFLLALLLLAAEVLPSQGKAVGIVRDDTPGSWAVVAGDFSAVDVKEIEGDDLKGYLGCYFEASAGKYLVIKSGGKKLKTFAVVLGGSVPVPPTPQPVPTPVPPEPPPLPTPAVGPLRVIILEETADRSKYSKDVTGSYLSAAVASYLRTHTTNSTWDWGIWDDDFTDADLKTGGFGHLVDAYTRAKTDGAGKLPWVVIEQKDAAGKPFTVLSAPATADTLGTLKRFGGP